MELLQYESNARFVRWSDGSIQLLIGNEVLDISVQEAQHDHTPFFLRHRKVLFIFLLSTIMDFGWFPAEQ